jgi:hypothetical protein
MSEELESLRAEVAALRAELAEQRRPDHGSVTRRRLLTGLLGVGAGGAASIATAPSASAADGEPVLLGEDNSATNFTYIEATVNDQTSEVYLGAAGWGVLAIGEDVGVLGQVDFGGVAGVLGYVDGPNGSGVLGQADDPAGIGVIATSKAGPAMAAQSELDGVTLELTPAARTGPPASMPTGLSEYRIGAVSVDEDGELWLCTATGAPGTWTRLLREDTAAGRTIPITPFRALDTRESGGRPSGSPAVPGQKQGPLTGGETITLGLAGVSPIPAAASGVVGSLIAVLPTYTGYLRAGASGSPLVATALSFTKGVKTGNAFTVKPGPDGVSFWSPNPSTNTYHLVVDITAYIT